MRELGTPQAANDTTVESACPACAGPLVARPLRSGAWVYCASCRRLSRSLLVPGPAGGQVMVHPLVAA